MQLRSSFCSRPLAKVEKPVDSAASVNAAANQYRRRSTCRMHTACAVPAALAGWVARPGAAAGGLWFQVVEAAEAAADAAAGRERRVSHVLAPALPLRRERVLRGRRRRWGRWRGGRRLGDQQLRGARVHVEQRKCLPHWLGHAMRTELASVSTSSNPRYSVTTCAREMRRANLRHHAEA